MSRSEHIKKTTAILVMIAAFGFVFYQLVTGWGQIRAQFALWEFRPGFLILSFALVLVNFLMTAAAYRWIIAGLGQPISFRASYHIFFTSQLGRYVPGKVWIVLGQYYIAEKLGMNKATVTTGGLYHVIVGNLAGLLLAALLLIFGYAELASPWIPGVLAVAILLALLFAPAQVERLLNPMLARLGKGPIRLILPMGTVAWLIIWLMALWCVSAASFAALVAAVMPLTWQMIPPLAAVFVGGYVIGFFAFIVPGGLGVREGLFTALLPAALAISPAVAGALALFSRMLISIAEVTAFFIARFLNPLKKR